MSFSISDYGVCQINATCQSGSTGFICEQISKYLDESGIKNYVLYSEGKSPLEHSYRYLNAFELKINALISRIFGNYGFVGGLSTFRIKKFIKNHNIKIVHFHNIHGNNINFKRVFKFLIKQNIRVIYTFHDCWAFTGYCTHFLNAKCYKWKTNCFHCPLRSSFSFFIDNSYRNQRTKIDYINKSKSIIITPSRWLAECVKESGIKNKISVINNGIDLNVFNQNINIENNPLLSTEKKVILGVASIWSKEKGIDDFIALAKGLPKEFIIVLIGKNCRNFIDKSLENIICIEQKVTHKELAWFYSKAEFFFNPTKEDTFPTVNIESIACGTPVVTYNVGGSPEIIDNNTGIICSDINEVLDIIKEGRYKTLNNRQLFKNRASLYESKLSFYKYIKIYKEILNEESSKN